MFAEIGDKRSKAEEVRVFETQRGRSFVAVRLQRRQDRRYELVEQDEPDQQENEPSSRVAIRRRFTNLCRHVALLERLLIASDRPIIWSSSCRSITYRNPIRSGRGALRKIVTRIRTVS